MSPAALHRLEPRAGRPRASSTRHSSLRETAAGSAGEHLAGQLKVPPVARCLRRQGDMWRGLLSGEKNPMNIASPTYYFAAMASVVRKVAGLAWSFLGTGIGLLLFLLLIVAGAALYVSATAKDTTGILSALVALLTTLG